MIYYVEVYVKAGEYEYKFEDDDGPFDDLARAQEFVDKIQASTIDVRAVIRTDPEGWGTPAPTGGNS